MTHDVWWPFQITAAALLIFVFGVPIWAAIVLVILAGTRITVRND